ncbi:unnamed protein product, partial [Ectocarpus sp. 12 AP-2014]
GEQLKGLPRNGHCLAACQASIVDTKAGGSGNSGTWEAGSSVVLSHVFARFGGEVRRRRDQSRHEHRPVACVSHVSAGLVGQLSLGLAARTCWTFWEGGGWIRVSSAHSEARHELYRYKQMDGMAPTKN